MVIGLDSSVLEIVSVLSLVVVLLLAAGLLIRIGERSLYTRLTDRFVLGVPWGTVTIITGLIGVYWVVQGGGTESGPVVQGFRSWSLWYPTGTILSTFSHASQSHLTGNVFGVLAFAPIVEYVWGHYPPSDERESNRIPVIDWWPRHPVARIGVFVGGIIGVGIASAVFVPGAVIGFSGVVFALAGFALVVRPITTVLAIVGIQIVRLLFDALQTPVITATTRTQVVSPSWVDTALQGHLFGLLIGAVLAVGFLQVRRRRPELLAVFFAALVFTVSRSLWGVYWYLGAEEFILYLAIGTSGLVSLALVIAFASQLRGFDWDLSSIRNGPVIAIGILITCIVLLGMSGLAYSLVSVTTDGTPDEGLQVEDYQIRYVDDAPDEYVNALTIPGFGSPLSANVSGVVVTSEQRNAWGLAVSSSQLALDGRAQVHVGGVTWRETVHIERESWTFIDGNDTYHVTAGLETRTRLYQSSPATSEMRINGSQIEIHPTTTDFELVVRDNQTMNRTALPDPGERVVLMDITFERYDDSIFARHKNTEIRIATANERPA